MLVLLDRMRAVPEGDIILYADAGCSICTSEDARRVWPIWVGIVERHPTHRICFHHGHVEETWAKGDLSVFLGCAGNPAIMKTPQATAGLQLMMNTAENRELVQRWLDIMMMEDGHYVTDAPSRVPNAPSFREHRHDQAIISLLMKIHGAARLPAPYKSPVHPVLSLLLGSFTRETRNMVTSQPLLSLLLGSFTREIHNPVMNQLCCLYRYREVPTPPFSRC